MKKKHKNLLLSTIESRRTNYFKLKKMAEYIDGICTLFILLTYFTIAILVVVLTIFTSHNNLGLIIKSIFIFACFNGSISIILLILLTIFTDKKDEFDTGYEDI